MNSTLINLIQERLLTVSLSFNDQILFVRCGSESAQEVIGVHKSLITEDSKFFCSVVKPLWNKSSEAQPTVDLTDEDPKIFKIYLEFLYGHVVHFDEKTHRYGEYETLFKAYVFGEKIMSDDFQNAVISAIIKFKAIGNCPAFQLAAMVYRGTPANSPLRKLLLDIYAKQVHHAWNLQKLYDLDCPEFLSDVIVALVNERPPIDRSKFVDWTERQEEFFKKSDHRVVDGFQHYKGMNEQLYERSDCCTGSKCTFLVHVLTKQGRLV